MVHSSKALSWSFFLILIFAVVVNLALISPFFLTIFLGWMLAEILRPFYKKMLLKKIRAAWASFIATVAIALVIVIPIAIFSVATIRQVKKVVAGLGQDLQGLEVLTEKAFNFPLVARFFETSDEFKQWLMAHAEAASKYVPGILSIVVGNVPNLLGQLALALIGCYFFLCHGAKFQKWIAPRIPLEPHVRARVAKRSTGMVVQSALATLVAAAAQAVIIFVGFLVLKLPIAFLAFGTAFIFAWLPVVGVTPVWGLAMIFLFVQGESGKALVMLGFGMLSGITDNFIRPWILKGSSDIHPLVSLIVIFGHIYFFGILGVFTGPVFAAVMIELLEIWPEISSELGLAPSSKRD